MNKRRDLVIIILVTVGFLLSYLMFFYISPAVYRTSPEYIAAQMKVETHDISGIVKYKSSSVRSADAGSIIGNLPGGDMFLSYTAEETEINIKYNFKCAPIDSKRIMLYNATALFALIDGLETVCFTDGSEVYCFIREDITDMYDNFSSILSSSVWIQEVRLPLCDDYKVSEYFSEYSRC